MALLGLVLVIAAAVLFVVDLATGGRRWLTPTAGLLICIALFVGVRSLL